MHSVICFLTPHYQSHPCLCWYLLLIFIVVQCPTVYMCPNVSVLLLIEFGVVYSDLVLQIILLLTFFLSPRTYEFLLVISLGVGLLSLVIELSTLIAPRQEKMLLNSLTPHPPVNIFFGNVSAFLAWSVGRAKHLCSGIFRKMKTKR